MPLYLIDMIYIVFSGGLGRDPEAYPLCFYCAEIITVYSIFSLYVSRGTCNVQQQSRFETGYTGTTLTLNQAKH